LTSSELKRIVEEGFTIGGHTLSHVHLATVRDRARVKEEIIGDKRRCLQASAIRLLDSRPSEERYQVRHHGPGFNTARSNPYQLRRELTDARCRESSFERACWETMMRSASSGSDCSGPGAPNPGVPPDKERTIHGSTPLSAPVPLSRTSLPISGWAGHRFDAGFVCHPDLGALSREDSGKSLVLLGSLFNPAKPEQRNSDILGDVFASTRDKDSLFSAMKRYAGRYALFYKDGRDAIVFHDALALREIYYSTTDNRVICGSQPNLLLEFAEPALEPERSGFRDYYAAMRRIPGGILMQMDRRRVPLRRRSASPPESLSRPCLPGRRGDTGWRGRFPPLPRKTPCLELRILQVPPPSPAGIGS
jgi:hypothetical protein